MTDQSIIVKAIQTDITEKQETFSTSRTYGRKKNEFVKIKIEEIQNQLNDLIAPLIANIESSNVTKNSTRKLSKVTIKLGFSMKGEIVIVSGQVDGAIELEFTNS